MEVRYGDILLRDMNVIEDTEAGFHNWMSDEKVTEFLRWPIHDNISISERVINEWIVEGGVYSIGKAI